MRATPNASVDPRAGSSLGRAPSGSWLRRHALFSVLFVTGLALRGLVLIAYQPALLLQRDAYVYLERAVGSAGGPGTFRPALYPLLFLRPLLRLDGLVLVAIAQHALGLVMALMLYRLVVRFAAPTPVAALGTAPLLLDGYQLDLEHHVLAETFFQGLVVGALALLVWRDRPGIATTASAGFVVALSGVTRFVGVALVIPALLYALVHRVGVARLAALALGFCLPLVAYSLWFKTSSGSFSITNRSGFFLYGRVASFADCARVEMPRELDRFCFDRPPSLRAQSPGVFGLIGVSRLERKEPQANELLLEFSRRMIFDRPLSYARAVTADLLRYFEPSHPSERESYVARWRFPRSLDDAEPNRFILRTGGSAPEGLGLEPFSINRVAATWLRGYQDVFYTPGPVLALLLALGLAGAAFGAGSLRAACLLFASTALALLLVPVATTVYHFRYVIPALPVVGAAGALGAAALHRRARR